MYYIYISRFQPTKQHIHQTEHKAGLSLLSAALSRQFDLNLPADELTAHMETGPWGKPGLKEHPEIHFNISHCKDMAVCAIGSSPIGADIEKIGEFNPLIIKKALTPTEQSFLNRMHTDERTYQEWFFRFWTLKESRIKHSGKGFSMPLTDFSFSFHGKQDPYDISCSDSPLCFYQRLIDNSYILSLCSSVQNLSPVIIRL